MHRRQVSDSNDRPSWLQARGDLDGATENAFAHESGPRGEVGPQEPLPNPPSTGTWSTGAVGVQCGLIPLGATPPACGVCYRFITSATRDNISAVATIPR